LTAKIAVRLTPRGGRDGVEGWSADETGRPFLKVRVSAPPIEGEANEALERLLAKVLKVAKSSVRVVSGTTARLKQVEITELEQEDALARLGFAPS
jgi:uncharacterized protein (TIGR00251 family)